MLLLLQAVDALGEGVGRREDFAAEHVETRGLDGEVQLAPAIALFRLGLGEQGGQFLRDLPCLFGVFPLGIDLVNQVVSNGEVQLHLVHQFLKLLPFALLASVADVLVALLALPSRFAVLAVIPAVVRLPGDGGLVDFSEADVRPVQ